MCACVNVCQQSEECVTGKGCNQRVLSALAYLSSIAYSLPQSHVSLHACVFPVSPEREKVYVLMLASSVKLCESYGGAAKINGLAGLSKIKRFRF